MKKMQQIEKKLIITFCIIKNRAGKKPIYELEDSTKLNIQSKTNAIKI